MVLSDNIIELRKQKPGLWEMLRGVDDTLATSPVKLVETKSGVSTLAVEKDGVLSYLHSKYDPVKEAEGIADAIDPEEVSRHDHIFLYGVGLGYLLDVLLKRYPGMFFTLYEPNAAAFCHLLSTRLLNRWPLRRIKFIFVDLAGSETEQNANRFFQTMFDRVMFVTLPSYERIFNEEFQLFSRYFVYSIKSGASDRACANSFQKLWTINSMVNFGQNLKNDTIFSHSDRQFRNRPAILAAAGPSLAPELERLRRIREEGSAYIFCVGSAVKALVKHGIYPHAAATMEPQAANVTVFQDIVDKEIDTIPMLYATSVGHESVARYPGPKLFMMIDKDNVTPYFLPERSRPLVQMVNDAPTIAITTLQAMIKLGFNPITLVGQNLAFLDNKYYSDGIEHPWEESPNKYENHEMVENVHGEQVSTMHSWIMSRKIMERLIAEAPDVTFFNATGKGARIEGASYKPLAEIMAEHLTERVLEEDWYKRKNENLFDPDYLEKQEKRMSSALEKLVQSIRNCEQILEHLKLMLPHGRHGRLIDQELASFDNSFKEVANNEFFAIFVNPMLMIENGVLQNGLAKIRAEKNATSRARYVVEEFGRFLTQVNHNLKRHASPLYADIKKNIASYVMERKTVATSTEL